MSSPTTCEDHAGLSEGYLARRAQFEWFMKHRYKQRRCGECGLLAIVVSSDGRLVESWWEEARLVSAKEEE